MAGEDRNDRERIKAIEMAVGQIEKQFGKGSIMRLGQKDAVTVDSFHFHRVGQPRLRARHRRRAARPRHRDFRTGILGQDDACRCRSSPRRRSSGGMAAFVDAEHALDAQYAQKLGVDLDNLLVSQPDNGEQALEIVEVLVRSNSVDVVVVDSVAALVPRAEIEGRDGRRAGGPAGAADVAGAAQAHRRRLEVEDLPDLHQPAPREDRRDVRQPRNHHRRPRAEVLLLGPHRHPPHRRDQGRRRRWSAAAPASRS